VSSYHPVTSPNQQASVIPIAIRPAYLRINDAAVYCSCSAEYLAKCCRKAQVSFIKKGRCVFFAVADLDSWMLADRSQAA
jgi:hypothetical protein